MSTILSQSFPVVKQNSGAFLTNAFFGVPPYGSDSPDPDYPTIASSEDVKVVAGLGPDGQNAADVDGDYVDSGIAFQGFGPLAGGYWDATRGCCTVSYKIASATAHLSDPIVMMGQGIPSPGGPIIIQLEPSGGNLLLRLQVFKQGATSFETHEVATYSVPFASLADDAWHSFRLQWKGGTIGAGDAFWWHLVSADGFMQVFLDGTLIYDVQNIKLYLRDADTAPNWLNTLTVGYDGLAGAVTALVLLDTLCETTTPPPTFVNSEPCCSTGPSGTGASGIGVTGPILPPASPAWLPSCVGGGTIPTAADIVESENWRL
jgi:hypothetical protein